MILMSLSTKQSCVLGGRISLACISLRALEYNYKSLNVYILHFQGPLCIGTTALKSRTGNIHDSWWPRLIKFQYSLLYIIDWILEIGEQNSLEDFIKSRLFHALHFSWNIRGFVSMGKEEKRRIISLKVFKYSPK